MRCVALGPGPADVVPGNFVVERFPQIAIDDRLLLRRNQAALFTVRNPLRDAVFYVLGVGDDFDLALLAQRAKPYNRGCELHAVDGGVGFAAEQFLAMFAVNENRRTSSASWISEARTIRDHLNFFHSSTVLPSSRSAALSTGPKHFYIFVFSFGSTCYIIMIGRIKHMATKKAAKKAAPKKAAAKKKATKKK